MDGNCKYYKQKKQVSYDGGSTWQDTDNIRRGALYERDSEDCDDEIKDYLRFIALEDTSYSWNHNTLSTSVEYSLDSGSTWNTLTVGDSTPTVSSGSTVMWRHIGSPMSGMIYNGYFGSTGNFNAEGNIMSMRYGSDFEDKTTIDKNAFFYLFRNSKIVNASGITMPATTLAEGCYQNMFIGCRSLTTAPSLPATTLAPDCYGGMFYGCTSLTTAPNLPATTLADNCYYSMFYGCSSLTTAPSLPVTTLELGCYEYMFRDCTSLTTAPSLPATTLASHCYLGMFIGCTSLRVAPDLPAEILVDACYYTMFSGCTNLRYIKCLATNKSLVSGENYTSSWVYGVSSAGTFVKAATCSTWPSGNSGIPSDWNVNDDYSPGEKVIKIAYNDGTSYTKPRTTSGTTLSSGSTKPSGYEYSAMTSAIIGDWIKSFDSYVFSGCSSLTTISIPSGVTSIDNFAFADCSSLTNIILPKNLSTIGWGAFQNCNNLANVVFGDKISGIGVSAFGNCTSLTSVTIPDSIKRIEYGAFMGCEGLNDVTIGSGITYIGQASFSECSALTSVTINAVIPPGIESSHFPFSDSNCPIYVPSESVLRYKKSWNGNFYPVNPVNRIQAIPNTNDGYGHTIMVHYSDGSYYNVADEIGDCYYASNILTSGVTKPIEFSNKEMASVVIGKAIDTIDDYAFSNCSGLTDVEMYHSVTTIGDFAFENCYSLPIIELPSSVTSIGNYAFRNCSGLTSIIIRATFPPSLGAGVFTNTNNCSILVPCDSVSAYKSASGWSTYSSRIGAIETDCTDKIHRTISGTPYCIDIEKYVNKYYQTSNDGGINWSTTSSTITLLNARSADCVSPQYHRTTSGTPYCNGNDKYVVVYSQVSFNSGATWETTASTPTLVEANSPDCASPKLTLIYSGGSAYTLACDSSTVLTSGETRHNETPFIDFNSTTAVTIGDCVEEIGVCAFLNYGGITSIIIPSGITTIAKEAFGYCRGLTNVNIPSGVTSIGTYAFRHCSGLQSVTVNRTTPPTLGTNVFTDTNNCTIYVPAASVSTYQSASGWSTYASRIQAIP